MAQQPPKPPSDGVRPPRHPMYGNSPTSPTSPLRATTATPAGASLEDVLTKDDQAERGLLLSMEERRTPFQTAGGDAWHASVAGERPPLGGAVPLDRLLPPPIVATTGHHQRMSSINTSNSHVSRNSHASRNSSMGSSRSSQHSVTKLADIARRMRQKTAAADGRTLSGSAGAPQQQQQQQQHLGGVNGNTASSFNENSVLSSITGIESHNATSSNLYHRRAPSRAHALLDSIQEQPDNQDGGVDSIFDSVGGSGNNTGEPDNQTGGAPSDLNQTMTHTDHLLTGAMQVEELFDDTLAIPPPISSSSIVPPEKNAEGSLQVQDFNEDINNTSETTPLNAPYHSYQYSVDSVIGDGVNMALDDTINNHVSDTHKSNSSHASTSKGQTNSHSVPHSHKKTSPMMMNAKHARQKAANNKKRSKLLLWALCHPWLLVQSIIRFLWYQTLLFSVTLPCVLLSALFFYVLSNPTWSFLPGHASVSWWFNFIGRQTILFEVARLWQWCLIDKIVLGTRIAVQCLGPLLTLCFIQARGWPFCIASWGFLDLLLLEGSSNLASHWFWFSNLSMYSQLDSGAYILNSDIYIRLLMSMIVAGIAVAIKRTSVAMSFGRRTFVEFKPRLEKLLKEVVLVSELAALAEEAELAASEELMEVQVDNKEQQRVTNVKFMGDVSWSNNNRRRDGHSPTKNVVANENETTDSDDDDDGDDDDESDDEDSEITTQNDILPERQSFRARQLSSTSCVLQGLLDHWEEPINKADKSLNASISDILRFRRALTFMDDDLMFGETFGPASTREQLINSAHRVYNRLLMLTPGREKVSCEFYDMLAQEDNGKLNNKKRKALRKLFRPNGANEISLLAFVRSCDALYKKLRYFRANVGNASIIDHALESIVDGAFGFILALVLLSVMRVNPWPLLVSISTLLVSISFAVGSSASKWFEGKAYNIKPQLRVLQIISLTNFFFFQNIEIQACCLWRQDAHSI